MSSIQEKLNNEWDHLNEGQEITSTEIFENLCGYKYSYKTVHPNEFNPISIFLTKMIRNGNGYKKYTDGIKKVIYVKATGIGDMHIINKFIHACDCHVGKNFNILSFKRCARLIWELKGESILTERFVSAAEQVGLIEKLSEFNFRIKCKSNKEMPTMIKKIMSDTTPLKKVAKSVEDIKDSPEIFVSINRDNYNYLIDTLQRQTKKIKELQVLKARLLDEAQEMSTKLKQKYRTSIVDPEDLIEEARAQL